jgi:hypothetical protein
MAQQGEAALRQEIVEESLALQLEKVSLANESNRTALSSEVQELRKAHKEITEEIQRLQ